ncbi:MAG: WhiB family transcriptional regulator [Acidimicrobiales bacterium]
MPGAGDPPKSSRPSGDRAREGHVVAHQHDDAWQIRAACRGPQAVVFFPPSYVERKDERLGREQEAKSICVTCSVREDCLDYALRIQEPHGIWGGLNEAERKQVLDRRVSPHARVRLA